jgi:hypothetical protein
MTLLRRKGGKFVKKMVRSHALLSGWRAPLVIAVLAALVVVGVAIGATSRGAVAPTNDTLPTIDGTAAVGSTLTADPGTWNGSSPITFQYQWLICGSKGEACSNIGGATRKTFTVRSGDEGNTIRVKVIAGNRDGSGNAQSDATKAVTGAGTTTTGTTTTTPTPSTGCPPGKGTISISQMSLPARLLIADSFSARPSTLGRSTQAFDIRVHVTNTCGQTVSGALVYVTATPYNQFDIPPEAPTNNQGDATLRMTRLSGYPVSNKQQLLALFIRARKDGEDLLAGVSVRRLVSIPVNLNQ